MLAILGPHSGYFGFFESLPRRVQGLLAKIQIRIWSLGRRHAFGMSGLPLSGLLEPMCCSSFGTAVPKESEANSLHFRDLKEFRNARVNTG